MEIFYGGYCRESDAPHSYGVNDLRSHTLLCPSLASTVFFFVFPIFILSHPAWDRIKSSRYYTEMCLCLPDMFSLSGPTVITFPGFQMSTHETANLPRECADLPRWMFFCFKTFMRLIH